MIELHNVTKIHHRGETEIQALRGVTGAIPTGTFTFLLGPSGSGKSTLFNLITGLTEPDTGEVLIDGQRVDGRTGMVGLMPQRDLLLPWRTVMNNVILGPEIDGVPKRVARRRAREMLPMFGLEGFENAYPDTLSGGMRQRAALLRTFLTDRSILLLDEPFGALDALTRRELQRWLLEMWRRFDKTILFITHDVEEAVYLADRVLVFSARPGRITKILTVDLPRPRTQVSLMSDDLRRIEVELIETLEAG